jgi:4-carboxymuconolactone decarboxylase
MGEKRAEAFAILKNMLAPEMADALGSAATAQTFAGKMGEMAMNNVFEPLWTDETFDLRTRSLVTVSMLIALRANDELEVHFPAAIRNGATIAELEQVLYQATGYAGFPAANSARTIAIAALRRAGMLD